MSTSSDAESKQPKRLKRHLSMKNAKETTLNVRYTVSMLLVDYIRCSTHINPFSEKVFEI